MIKRAINIFRVNLKKATAYKSRDHHADPYIQQFIEAMSPDVCWELYPEYIEGLTEQEISIYADMIDIDVHGALKKWLLTFGRCSGGLFISDHFHHFAASSYKREYIEYIKRYPEFRQDMIEDGLISFEQVLLKPFDLYRENETNYYFVFTKDPDLFVWFYTDGDDEPAVNTGLKFDDFIKSKLGTLKCREGIWIPKHEIIPMSTSYLFE